MDADLNLDDGSLVISYDDNHIGIGEASPEYKLEVLDASTQLLLTYSDGVDTEFYTDSSGNLNIRPTGGNTYFGNSNLATAGNITGANITGSWTGSEIGDASVSYTHLTLPTTPYV